MKFLLMNFKVAEFVTQSTKNDIPRHEVKRQCVDLRITHITSNEIPRNL